MRHRQLQAWAFFVLISASTSALAVYRCEHAGGTTYSDAPCPGGRKVELTGRVAVSEADAALAKQRLQQNKAEVARIERERGQREAAAGKQRQAMARKAAAGKAKCATLARRLRWAEEDASRAVGKAAGKAGIKARRMAEQYDAECDTGDMLQHAGAGH
jgi:hypothetical protein